MLNTKKLLGALLAASLVLLAALPGQAAEKDKAAAKVKPPAPVVIEGDELYFSDLTGNIFAKGSVVVTQGDTKMLGPLIRGNSKSNDLWIDDKATYLEPGNKLTGSAFHYNYKEHTGSFVDASGTMGRELVAGKHIDLVPDGYVIYDGTMTGCPAKVPDYHVSATKVEIWPGDKLVAYNAKFWIKDKVIYTMPKYQKSLRKDSQSEFPRLGYTSQDGWYIAQYLEYPLANTDSGSIGAYTDLAYYGKRGFKPIFGLFDRERLYSLNLVKGDFRDGNNYWITKEPELRFDWHPQRLGKLPVSYSFYAIYGKWTDSAKSAWHQDYNLYFSGDEIKINNLLSLYLGTGFERITDKYIRGDSGTKSTNSFRYDGTLYQFWSPKLTTWVAYHNIHNNYGGFLYGSSPLSRSLDTGIAFTVDKMNKISYYQSYDLELNNVYEKNFVWDRNLHCWQATVKYTTYRDRPSQLSWYLSTNRF